MKALELFNAGALGDAIASATEEVKQNPGDAPKRIILAELLCYTGEFERADKQLETALMQAPDLNLATGLERQLIRAAAARRKCFDDGAVPDMLAPADPILEKQLKMWTLHRAGEVEQASEILEELQEYCDGVVGVCGESDFVGFRDLDDSTASCLEILTSTGKYYWVPWHRIESLAFEPVKRPRDLLWREAHILVRQGPDAVVYVPVSYPATTVEDGDGALLGRTTEWQEPESGPVTGIGQRVFLVGEEEKSILEIEQLQFAGLGETEVGS